MKDSVSDAIRDDVLLGLSMPDLIVAHPGLKPNSIKTVATRIRRRHNIQRDEFSRHRLHLPERLARVFQDEASNRTGHQTGSMLALRLLAIIAKNDLFDELLGEVE